MKALAALDEEWQGLCGAAACLSRTADGRFKAGAAYGQVWLLEQLGDHAGQAGQRRR